MKRGRFRFENDVFEIQSEWSGDELCVKCGDEEWSVPILMSRDGSSHLILNNRRIAVTAARSGDDYFVHMDGHVIRLQRVVGSVADAASSGKFDGTIMPPMPGNIVKVMVSEGDTVKQGETLLIMESMKMEQPITTPEAGVVKAIHVREGELAELTRVLVEIDIQS